MLRERQGCNEVSPRRSCASRPDGPRGKLIVGSLTWELFQCGGRTDWTETKPHWSSRSLPCLGCYSCRPRQDTVFVAAVSEPSTRDLQFCSAVVGPYNLLVWQQFVGPQEQSRRPFLACCGGAGLQYAQVLCSRQDRSCYPAAQKVTLVCFGDVMTAPHGSSHGR